MKRKIYHFLDLNYPITGLRIDAKFDPRVESIVHSVFGVEDITIFDWAKNRIGNIYNFDIRGDIFWFKDGLQHRDNNLPAVEFSCGVKVYWVHGKVVSD